MLSNIPERPGQLLLIHGLCDENVLFTHSAQLVKALNRRGHAYSLVLFLDERHGVRKADNRVYVEARIDAFLRAQLLGAEHE